MHKKTVLKHFNGRSKLADALGITPEAISQWGDVIPKVRAYEIERITGGELEIKLNLYKKNRVA